MSNRIKRPSIVVGSTSDCNILPEEPQREETGMCEFIGRGISED